MSPTTSIQVFRISVVIAGAIMGVSHKYKPLDQSIEDHWDDAMLLGCFQIVRDSFLSGGAAKGSFQKGTLVFCLGIPNPRCLL
jgi:hypothetical protein